MIYNDNDHYNVKIQKHDDYKSQFPLPIGKPKCGWSNGGEQ